MSVQSDVRTKRIWEGAFILTLAGLLTKILSAGYRIPYQNIAGDVGFYIYQQVYPIYGVALVFSTYGFPVILSKILVEYTEQSDQSAISRVLSVTFATLMTIGFVLFGLLYWGSDVIAVWMGDKQLSLLIKVISFSFLLLPVISTLRGYFQGRKFMVPTAVSQVGEQLIRVATILLMSFLLLNQGYGAYKAGAGAIFGSITGGFAAIFLLLFYVYKKGDRQIFSVKSLHRSSVKTAEIIRVILSHGFTICVSAMLLILFQLVDSFSVYSLLLSGGMEQDLAKQAKGVYDRAQPLLQLGTIVATSLSLSLVPLIASAKARSDMSFIYEKVNMTIRLSMVVGTGAAVGLACVLRPTNIMLYENSEGTNVILVMGLSVLFTTLIQTFSGIIQGLNHPLLPALSVLLGMIVKWQLNIFLVPAYKTMGAAIATLGASIVITGLHFLIMKKKLPGLTVDVRFIKPIAFSTGIMVVFITGYLHVLNWIFPSFPLSRIFASFESLSSVLIGGFIYLLFILKGRVFTEEEISLIPLGEKREGFFKFVMKRM